MVTKISHQEFAQRITATQAAMESAGLDILITYGNEAEPQYVRYYSDYWPSFESACVLIPLRGEPVLLIGPESLTMAASWSVIPRIEKIKLLRESSEPEYPGAKLNTLYNLFGEFLSADSCRRIGIVGYPLMNTPVYEGICKAASAYGCEVVRSEQIVIRQKMIKTPSEIEIMRHAAKISEAACVKAIQALKPGMTETQLVGVAEAEMRALGAENEAYPNWVLTGNHTSHAIGRPNPFRKIEENDLVQLQIGARVSGYASSVGRPVIVGDMPKDVQELVEIGLEAHLRTYEWLKPGKPASEVAKEYQEFLKSRGAEGCALYGPCHGTGLMEGEHPWIETTSDYLLEPGLTFMCDTFIHRNGYGLRWEDQLAVTETGVDVFTDAYSHIIRV